MSLFNRIISIGDVQSRLPQLDFQVDKLEAEDLTSRDSIHHRRGFTKRCHELYKQIDDYKNRIKDMKKMENTEVQRLTALEQLEDLQVRLLRLAPERDRMSSGATSPSRSTDDTGGSGKPGERSVRTKPSTNHESTSLTVQETPILVHTPQPYPETNTITTRRGSLMYDAASDGEDDEHDSEAGADVEEESQEAPSTAAGVQVKGPSLQRPPRHQKNVPPIVATPPVESKGVYSGSDDTVASTASAVDTARLAHGGAVVDGSTFVVLGNLQAAQPGDLSITEGEILKIVQTRPDGWWTARNSKGIVGLVPKTYLRQVASAEDRWKTDLKSRGTTLSHPKTSASNRPPIPPPKNLSTFNQTPTRPARCLGDAQELDSHLSFACHLTPRLSHSNIGFHDLYWNYRDDKLRKRRVRVSKLVRLVRLEGMPKENTGVCLVRAALYDRSRRTGRQIVSNVHTIRAQVKNRTWTFNTRTDTTSSGVDYGDFIIRSNYNMTDVVLLIEASHVVQTQSEMEERSLGIITIDLINKGEVIFNNKTYCETLRAENIFDRTVNSTAPTSYKIVLKVLDVPQDLVPFVDSMPDVLLFNPMFVRLYFFFRRRAGTTLLRERDNLLSAEMISDPFLALFPSVADQPDIMDHLRSLWNLKLKKPESEQAVSFFHLFMNTAYCIHNTAVMPPYRIWDEKALAIRRQLLKKCEDMLREYRTSTRFLLTEPCLPLNVYDYSFDLLGRHALD